MQSRRCRSAGRRARCRGPGPRAPRPGSCPTASTRPSWRIDGASIIHRLDWKHGRTSGIRGPDRPGTWSTCLRLQRTIRPSRLNSDAGVAGQGSARAGPGPGPRAAAALPSRCWPAACRRGGRSRDKPMLVWPSRVALRMPVAASQRYALAIIGTASPAWCRRGSRRHSPRTLGNGIDRTSRPDSASRIRQVGVLVPVVNDRDLGPVRPEGQVLRPRARAIAGMA